MLGRRELSWYSVGFAARIVVAAWNGFWGPSFGGEYDAASYHRQAVEFAQRLASDQVKIGSVYPMALGAAYRLISDSLFFGGVLSCCAWLMSALAFSSILDRLHVPKDRRGLVSFTYAMLPSSIIFNAITLREAYQLLFVNLAFLSALALSKRESNAYWGLLAVSAIGMAFLHGALFAFAVYAVGATVVFAFGLRGRGRTMLRLALAAPVMAFVVVVGLGWFTAVSYNLDEGVGAAVEVYQQAALSVDARTHYKQDVDIGGIAGLVTSLPASFMQYQFEPMPWRATTLSDAVLIAENVARALMMLLAFRGMRSQSKDVAAAAVFLFASFVVVEVIWSMGTINWGTAARHHLPGLGLLAAAAAAGASPRIDRSDERRA